MNYALKVVTRSNSGKKTRANNMLPGVMYGAGGKSESISIDLVAFNKLYKLAGESSLVDLTLDDKDAGKVIIQDVQFDPVSDRVIHVDLRRIDMNKAMTAPVGLRFVGEPPVVKAQGGTLVTSVQTVEVQCLPKDLVSYIEVDLSGLNTFDDLIKIKDLTLPAGITILSPAADALVAKAARAITEEEIKAMEEAGSAAVDLTKIESAKPKAAEGEEGAEGAAAAGDKPAEKKEEKKEEKK